MNRRAHGFTLMEMLVTLVLISFATMLMFQMLGSYRIASERVQAKSGLIDRNALFQGWFRDSVHGLFIAEGLRFDGQKQRFAGTTLNPLYAQEGAPTSIVWALETGMDGGRVVSYAEDGKVRWRSALADDPDPHFVYLDSAGKESDTWPPRFGVKDDLPTLPASILLVRSGRNASNTMAASVLGPLKPERRLFTGEDQPP